MTKKICTHCKNIQKLYPDKKLDYNPKSHTNQTCPILKQTICFNCKEYGHTPKYCPKPQNTCILCCRVGHKDDGCGYISQILLKKVEKYDKPIKNLSIKRIDWLNL